MMRFVNVLLLSLFPLAATAQTYVPLESPITQNGGRFSQAIALGNLDGDDALEIIISTRQSEPSNENANGAGRVYVLDAEGTVLLTLNPPNPEDDGSFGQAAAIAGDADNDGSNDVFVCAPNEDPNGLDRAGQLHVFSGMTGAFIRTQPSPNPKEQAFFCSSITTVDDLDADGQPDLLVGAASEDGGAGSAGRVYAFSSTDGSIIYTLESPNAVSTSQFGQILDNAGDFNSDGVSDLLISASGEVVNGFGGAGRVYVFSGSDGALLKTYEALDPDGEAAFGNGLAVAGDLNNDSTPDLFVAATVRSGETGKVHALSGVDGALLYTITTPSSQEDDAFANGFGNGIASVPDLNGDGRVEVLVGAPSDAQIANDAGRAYLFSGADGILMNTFTSPNAGFISRFGATLAAGDATGDGIPELLIGAPTEAASIFAGGRAYLISNLVSTAIEEIPHADALGLSVAPNPVQHTTNILFELTSPSPVNLSVYDVLGRRIAVLTDGLHAPGTYTVPFDATRLPGGVYFVQINAKDIVQTQRFVLAR